MAAAAAASLLPSSSTSSLITPTNNLCKMHSAAWLDSRLYQLLKGFITSAVYCLPCKKCNVKLYMVSTPGAPFSRHCRRLATNGTVEVDGTNQEDRLITSGDHSPSNLESIYNLERQLDGLFDEVKTLIRLGKENDAFDLLQANYVAVKQQMDTGARGIEEAAILDVIALGYMALSETRMVASVLAVVKQVVEELKDDEPLLDSILLHMGNMYEKVKKFEMALYQYRRALRIMEQKYGNSSTFLVTPMLGIAKVLGSTGRATESIETYHLVIKILESGRGVVCEELLLPLTSLGNLLLKEGRSSEAENVFKRILDQYIKLYGEKDGRIGMAMCSLAHVKCATGDVHEAIDLYKDAFQVLKHSKSIALDDELMEKMRIDVAELLHAVGRGEEGRVLLEECLLITEKYQGKDHPSCVIHLMNLAASYSQFKNFAEAERLLRKSLQIMMKTVPPDDQSITFPMLHLAVVLYNLNQDEEAEKFALNALHIREKAFGEESLPVGEALDCVVSIQTRLGRDDKEILKRLQRVLKIQELALGHDSKEVVETLKKVIYYLDKLEMRSEKLPLQRRLSRLRQKLKEMV
ncbi:unnamed protein product [Coffea canephora]|uniref:MalT-like TPR region domain-containing protein n=1 Tax=Coffea canephora TaxID=49390 RepID=A0A068UBM4_COFCA|nr:unnamed protein product [Coffea canephora]